MKVYLLRDLRGDFSFSTVEDWQRFTSCYKSWHDAKLIDISENLHSALRDNLFAARTQSYLRELWNEN